MKKRPERCSCFRLDGPAHCIDSHDRSTIASGKMFTQARRVCLFCQTSFSGTDCYRCLSSCCARDPSSLCSGRQPGIQLPSHSLPPYRSKFPSSSYSKVFYAASTPHFSLRSITDTLGNCSSLKRLRSSSVAVHPRNFSIWSDARRPKAA